jgi:cytidyltransferase-like protein
MKKNIISTGCFDNLCSKQVRFLYETARSAKLTVLLFDDDLVQSVREALPKFPLPERRYYLESIRYVDRVHVISDMKQLRDISTLIGEKADQWVVMPSEETPQCRAFAEQQNIVYRQASENPTAGFPEDIGDPEAPSSRKKVIVTGSFDWFHSGHVRFLEEASEYGDLYVVVGHDDNIKLLKGPGHPLFTQDERRFITGSIRFVKQSLISTGHGWMDAEPEIHRLRPDIYIVNEDGDKPEKRQFCLQYNIEYKVLKRTPKEGLQRRTSTNLRGF